MEADRDFESVVRLTADGEVPRVGIYLQIVRNLEVLGWRRGVDLAALPYDWRQGPEVWTAPGHEFDRLQAEIEALSRRNGAPVVLISLSLGSPFTSLFLSRTSAAWRRQYIARHVSFSGAYGGTTTPLNLGLAADDRSASPAVLEPTFRRALGRAIRSFPSLLWLSVGAPSLPSWRSSTLAETPSRKYAPSEIAAFMGAAYGPEVADAARIAGVYAADPGKYDPLAAVPDYELHCLIG